MRTTPAEVIDRYRRQGWWTDTTVDDLFRAATAADRGRLAVIDPANRAALGLGEAELAATARAVAATATGSSPSLSSISAVTAGWPEGRSGGGAGARSGFRRRRLPA